MKIIRSDWEILSEENVKLASHENIANTELDMDP